METWEPIDSDPKGSAAVVRSVAAMHRDDAKRHHRAVTVAGATDQTRLCSDQRAGYDGIIPLWEYNGPMPWQVEYTDQFKEWWYSLNEAQQEDLAATVELLMERGPTLPYPYSSGIATSRHSHMRELRTQSGGEPLRTFYAFDPRRVSILLIGGIKTGNDRFYEEYVPIADTLYDDHLEELREEGIIP